jgi:hypothetical protein
MTNATIFEPSGDNQGSNNASATTEENLLSALVGETQKYKTVDELAKAYVNADGFINQLKEENRQLREQAAAAKTIDEVLERLSKQDHAPVDDNPPASGIKPEDVQQLVEKTLQSRELMSKRNNNLMTADKLMKDKFGEKAEAVFKQRASTPEKAKALMELAAIDPNEFVALFVGSSSAPANNMDTSSVNSTNVMSMGGSRESVEGTKEWAAKVRKENPSLYWSQEFQYKLQQTVTKNPTLYFGN